MTDGWEHDGDRLKTAYKFKTFTDAIAFMAEAADKIEQMDHHPEWKNIHRMLYVELTTHSSGGVTHLDEELARHLDALFARF